MGTLPELWTVSGSSGRLLIDATDGEVLFRDCGGDTDYNDIVRFDVAEYRAWVESSGEVMCVSSEISGATVDMDILDIGFWDATGMYEPACAEYRTRWWMKEGELP